VFNDQIPVRSTISSYINYILSFRLVKFGLALSRPFFWPIILAMKPFEYTIFVLTYLKQWLTHADRNTLLDRLLRYVDSFLSELEDKSLLCTAKISCQIPPEVQNNRAPSSIKNINQPINIRHSHFGVSKIY
jgi:hypothetical protein